MSVALEESPVEVRDPPCVIGTIAEVERVGREDPCRGLWVNQGRAGLPTQVKSTSLLDNFDGAGNVGFVIWEKVLVNEDGLRVPVVVLAFKLPAQF
jgi:hypothetical protein